MSAHASPSKIERISGPAVAVRGNDIDTDRIIPARYLKTITFDGLGDHVFEDDRREATGRGLVHPIDRPQHRGAKILVAAGNFGCGSSREHAPQAIARWGIQAIVAVSFAEIFFGNSMMIGLPCATASGEDVERLMALAEAQPSLAFTLDVAAGTMTAGELTVPVVFPASARSALLSGNWDATALLVDQYEDVERVARALPYTSAFAATGA